MIQLYNYRCEEVIPDLENESIDLVITSPPYNVDLGNNKYKKNGYTIHDDNMNYEDYIVWLKSIFNSLYSKMKKDGRVCINIGDGKNGEFPTSSDIIQFMKEIGYKPYTHIIWNKNTTSNRAAFGSYLSPSCPSFPTPFEHILVFYKESKKKLYKGQTDLNREEFIKYAYSLWTFPPEKRQKELDFPAPFPYELPYRLIKMFSYIGDLIFDPFLGSGTSGLVSKELNRNFIGCEISEKDFNNAKRRIFENGN